MSRSVEFLLQPKGRHQRTKNRSGLLRRSKVFSSVAIALIVAVVATASFTILSQSGSTARGTRPDAALSQVSSPQLTAAQAWDLRHLTATQAAEITTELERAFSKDRIRVGLGTAGIVVPGQTSLASYDWSGGVSWDHAWLTASYANLAAAARAANKAGTVIQLASPACGLIDGVGAVICGVIANIIALLVENIHITSQTNHGVWGAYYWFTGQRTGGYW